MVFISKEVCVYGAFVLLFLIYINDIYTLAVRQTTQIDVSLSCYVLICWSMHQMSEKCKIDIYIIRHTKSLFLNWLSSWEFSKDIFSQNWKENWNKEIHCSKKKKKSTFKTQVISFLNLKHTTESRGVSVMLNLVFYVFKACVRYFYQIFIFTPNDSPLKTMKNVFYFI